jgi:hypothetical protein
VKVRDAVLLADPQCPSGMVGGRRWVMAKDVNLRGALSQRLGEGQRVPERLGAFYRCRQLIDGPIRVAEHPGDQRQVEPALHAGVRARPIRELHVRIEHLQPRRKCASAGSSFPCQYSTTPSAICAPTRRAASSSRSATRNASSAKCCAFSISSRFRWWSCRPRSAVNSRG